MSRSLLALAVAPEPTTARRDDCIIVLIAPASFEDQHHDANTDRCSLSVRPVRVVDSLHNDTAASYVATDHEDGEMLRQALKAKHQYLTERTFNSQFVNESLTWRKC